MPRHLSPTMSFTPSRPRPRRHWKKLTQLALSYFMLSAAPRTSRYPSLFTAIATRTATFSNSPPQLRCRYIPSIWIYGYFSPCKGRFRQSLMWTYPFLFNSLMVEGGYFHAPQALGNVLYMPDGYSDKVLSQSKPLPHCSPDGDIAR